MIILVRYEGEPRPEGPLNLYRPHTQCGKVMFSVCLGPQIWDWTGPPPPLDLGLDRSPTGPLTGQGTPLDLGLDMRPPFPENWKWTRKWHQKWTQKQTWRQTWRWTRRQTWRQTQRWTRRRGRGRYSSCSHAGGLSCYLYLHPVGTSNEFNICKWTTRFWLRFYNDGGWENLFEPPL